MKIHIFKDERCPDYYVSDSGDAPDGIVEIPTELYEEYKKIEQEYDRMQDELKTLMEACNKS